MTRVVALSGLMLAGVAAAHDADVIYVQAQSTAVPGEVLELITLTGAALGQLAPVDADGDGVLSQADLDGRSAAVSVGVWDEVPLSAGGQACGRTGESARLREGAVELTGRFQCAEGELRQDFRILRVLPANFRVVLGSQVDGEAGQTSVQAPLTSLPVPRAPPPGSFSRARFEQGLAQGAAAVLWLGALGAILVVLGSARSWRQGLLATALLALGQLVGAFLPLPPWSVGGLMLILTVWAAARGPLPLAVSALVGLAVAGAVGGGPWSSAGGTALGALAALALVGPTAVALGQLLQRRPNAWRWVRWGVTCAVCFAVGFRVAA